MTFVHQTPIRPETLPEAGHAALSDAVRAYDETLTAMQSGQDYASQLSAALASAQDGKGGETEAMAALRRHMVQDLRRNADSASATLARSAHGGVSLAGMPAADKLAAATCLADLGFEAAEAGDVPVNALEEVGKVNRDGLDSQLATVARCPEIHLPGHWDSRPSDFSFGGFGHGGILSRTGPDGSPRRFRLLGGRFHHATKSKRVLSISTEIGLSILPLKEEESTAPLGESPSFLTEVLPNADTPVESPAASRFHTARGQEAFQMRTQRGKFVGWSSGSGHSKHGHAIFASVCRTGDYTSRLATISRYRSSKSLGKKVPLERHPAPAATADIADRLAPNDPFSAYYAPEITPPDDLVVFTSPYFKVISGGPDAGPAIILWLRAYREATSGKIIRNRLRRSHELFFL